MIRPAFIVALLILTNACTTAPVPAGDLAQLDDFALLQEMRWIDEDAPDDYEFGPGGRAAYIENVRAELLARHPNWPGFIVEAIDEHRVFPGMRKTQVVTAIGWPNEYPGILWAERNARFRHPFEDPLDQLHQQSRANYWTYGDAPNNLHLWFDDVARLDRMIDNDYLPRQW